MKIAIEILDNIDENVALSIIGFNVAKLRSRPNDLLVIIHGGEQYCLQIKPNRKTEIIVIFKSKFPNDWLNELWEQQQTISNERV